MKLQTKFVIIMIIDALLLNLVLCAPQGESQLKPDESDVAGAKVTLDERMNWGGVFEGAFQVFNGARKIYHAIQEDDSSSSIDARRS
jgi:hypothetical protein